MLIEPDVTVLEGLGSTLGLAPNPQPGGVLGNSVAAAVRELRALDQVALQAKSDRDVSEELKARRINSARSKVEQEVAKQQKMTEPEKGQIAADEARLYAPPALGSADTAGSDYDRELRARFLALPRDQQTGFEMEMRRGQHPELLLALARDQFPNPYATRAKDLWRESVAAKHPQRAQALETRKAHLAWAETSLRAVARRAAQGNT